MKKLCVDSNDVTKWSLPFDASIIASDSDGAYSHISEQAVQNTAHQQGYDKAKHEVTKQFEQNLSHITNEHLNDEKVALAQLMSELQELSTLISDEVKNALVSLSLTIAEQLCRTKLNTSPDALMPLISEAISLMPISDKSFKVFVCPQTHQQMQNFIDDPSLLNKALSFVVDDSLKPGDFIIENDLAKINASVQQRVAHLANELQ